ncbi:MAG TPA: sulfurtransferase [Rhodanobacteraceae bacterium]|nr:sulfurtransferase [Rhodanobacteraceae bacterium]
MNGATERAPVVSAVELVERMRAGDVLAVDCRFDLADPAAAVRAYADAHVPGAVYADLDHDLADLSKTGEGRHPVPDAAGFSATLSRWGWRSGMTLVAYDAAGGALAAARLWWLMRIAGHEGFVLDGGLPAWRDAGLPLESAAPTPTALPVEIVFDRSQTVGFAELERRRADGSVLLLDARARDRYLGRIEPIDAVAGHVPGARNRPFSDNLQADGRFKTPGQLQAEFAELLAGRNANEVVHMCGSGVTACHNLLAMEHAGLSGSRVFAPSWSGWIDDSRRPVASGEE